MREFRQIFLSKKIISLDDINFNKEIDETGTTLKQNALIKVREVFSYSNKICISDDSGLEIDYLNSKYDLNIPEGEYDTLGGLILNYTREIPKKNEKINFDNFTIKILSINNNRIDNVFLRKN